MRYFCLVSSFIVFFCGLEAQKPIELGHVEWLRNYDEALAVAQSESKNIFILFQEVPGCSTCQQFGKSVLAHPLIVEAIEEFFIPLAIHNNKPGHDEKILKLYKEPAWNNPVVQLVDQAGKRTSERLSGNYHAYSVVQYMTDDLRHRGIAIPSYLNLLQEELQADFLGTKESYISMYCFWSGEKHLGKLKGVSYTQAGFMDGKEVVFVRYSPSMISYESILDYASSAKCADGIYSDDKEERKLSESKLGKGKASPTKNFRLDKQDKYYLSSSNLRYLPLTDLQKTRINSMLGEGLDASSLLSPLQKDILSRINQKDHTKQKSLLQVDFRSAWKALEAD